MFKNKFLIFGILIIVAVVAVSGCTSQNNTAPNTVNIQNNAFNPNSLTVQTGTTVNWVNLDSNTHRVTSDSDVFDSGNLSKDQSYSFTFSQPGTYTYHCTLHPNEVGTIIVTASSTNPSNPSTPSNPSNPSTSSNPSTPSTTSSGSPLGY